VSVDTFMDHLFVPLNRNPYIGSFMSQAMEIVLTKVDVYSRRFPDSKTRAEGKTCGRRMLEDFTRNRRANRLFQKRTKGKNSILLGDMSVPMVGPKESTYKGLVRFAWQSVNYISRTGSPSLGNEKTAIK